MWSTISSCFRSLTKYCWHFLTGSCEIERICRQRIHSSIMTWNFSISLVKSKILRKLSKRVFLDRNFEVDSTMKEIMYSKCIKNKDLIMTRNISRCLHDLNHVNLLLAYLNELKNKTFNYDDNAHVNILQLFWENMKPNESRRFYNLTGNAADTSQNYLKYISSDWGEVGFQSHDPSTDFRSMGLLGLLQLAYFSNKYGSKARDILCDSQHPRRYYPFAATGINITYFISTLLTDRRLDLFIYSYKENTDSNPIEVKDELLHHSCPQHLKMVVNAVYDLYCHIYIDFSNLWIKRDPENIMSFKAIFQEVCNSYYQKYPKLEA